MMLMPAHFLLGRSVELIMDVVIAAMLMRMMSMLVMLPMVLIDVSTQRIVHLSLGRMLMLRTIG